MDIFVGLEFKRYYQQMPLLLVDVGAGGGLDERWNLAEKHLEVIGFEPNSESFGGLLRFGGGKSRRCLNVALYNEKTTVNFYVTLSANQSSIFRPDQPFLDKFPGPERYEIKETVKIATDTLDSQMKEQGIKNVDFIKLDTQGSELFILQGAVDLLNSVVFGLEVEVAFAPRYLNQPLFSDVDSYLRQYGFQLFDVRPVYLKRTSGQRIGGPKGQLITGDALYLRSTEGLVTLTDGLKEPSSKKSKVLNALSICFLYGYLDYALECFNTVSNLFSKEEGRLLVRHMKRNVVISNRIPNFIKGRERTAKLLHKLWMIIQRHDKGYAPAGRQLGNLM